jgi:hypothetical protein
MTQTDLHQRVEVRADPALRPALLEVLAAFSTLSFSADRARDALVSLFERLSSPGIRTSENCAFVEHYLMDVESVCGSHDMPARYREFLCNANALHDAITAPAIAENFGCLPEQLMAEARTL